MKSSKGNVENPFVTVHPRRGSCIKLTAPIETDQIETNKYLFGNFGSAKITRITGTMFMLISSSCASILHRSNRRHVDLHHTQLSHDTTKSARNLMFTRCSICATLQFTGAGKTRFGHQPFSAGHLEGLQWTCNHNHALL